MTEHAPTIGLSFIFRDDETTIEAFLTSFLPYADQVVAVDTGSSDGSRAIVERLLAAAPDARIVDHDWFGWDDPSETLRDFSAARQQGFDLLETDWFLWGDADDELDGGEELRRIVQAVPASVGAVICNYDYAQAWPGGPCCCSLNRERLVRRSIGWKWLGNVHEVLAPQSPCDFMPAERPIWRHRKVAKPNEGDRNLIIIESAITEAEKRGEAPDPRMLVYRATELAGRGKHKEAVEAFQRYVSVSGWGEEKHQALHRMADCLRALGSHEEAMQVETYAMTHAASHGVAEWPDHLHGVGDSLLAMGQPEHAAVWFERALACPTPRSNLILNPRDYDYYPLFQLSLCYSSVGQFARALDYAKRAYEILPNESLANNMHLMTQKAYEQQTVETSIAYLESLIRYDEGLKARQALRTVPAIARTDPRVRGLMGHIRSSYYQAGSKRGYEEMYATNRETRNPDDFVENASEQFSRVAELIKGIEEQKKDLPAETPFYLLDAGCNDGWVAAHVEGIKKLCLADGIDLNPAAVAAARDRAERYDLKGRYEVGFVEDSAEIFGEGRYDAIALFEVYEHLEDTHGSIEKLERALRPGGRIYISTPAGSFDKGLVPDLNRAQHLRAESLQDFAAFALRRGDLKSFNVGREGVQTLSYTPQPKKGTICFYFGGAFERWGPLDITDRGLGGSETALTMMAEGLARRGWFVEVFGAVSQTGPINGVLWRDDAEFDPEVRYDIFISSRNAQIVDLRPEAGRRILWCHDAHLGGTLTERIEHFDEVLCLSQAHEESLRIAERLTDERFDEKFSRTRNGIRLSRYNEGTRTYDKRHPTVIYSSSPDRGLEKLIELWPRIKKGAPKAQLKIFYGFEIFDKMRAHDQGLMAWKTKLVSAIEALKDEGVQLVGRVDQARLSSEQMQARVWAYPYPYDNPTETSCITAMEAMAAGMFIVATESGALPETIGDGGMLLQGSNEAFPDDFFVEEVIAGLRNAQRFKEQQVVALERAKHFSWSSVADEWDRSFSATLKVSR